MILALVVWLVVRLDIALAGQQTISLDLSDADVAGTVRLLAERGGLNVVISDGVKGKVTAKLVNVPVEDALEILLRVAGLGIVRRGSVIGILPRETLLRQERQEAEARARPTEFRTEIVKLQFAKATELARTLAPFLSPWGKIAADYRTNSLIIRDVPDSSVFQLLEYTAEEARPRARGSSHDGRGRPCM